MNLKVKKMYDADFDNSGMGGGGYELGVGVPAGFTGFNPDEAKANIDNFENHHYDANVMFYDAMVKLFDGLSIFWCSPNAVKFDNKYRPIIEAIYDELINNMNIICRNAAHAFNHLAEANSCSDRIDLSKYETGNWLIELKELKEKNDLGVVGMNKLQVKNVVSTFSNEINATADKLDYLPSAIAFYDDGGEMQAAFDQKIQTAKNKVINTMRDMRDEINTAIMEEQNTIDLAKKQSVNTMNG